MAISDHVEPLGELNKRLESLAARLETLLADIVGPMPQDATLRTPDDPPFPGINAALLERVQQAHLYTDQLGIAVASLEDAIRGNTKIGGGPTRG